MSVFDIFDAHGIDNCKIELVEECPCESKEQLHKREGFYIQHNECVNKRIPGRTMAEWKSANAERVKQLQVSWTSANPEKVKEASRRAREKHQEKIKADRSAKCVCDVCGSEHTHHMTARHKRTKKHLAAEALLHAGE